MCKISDYGNIKTLINENIIKKLRHHLIFLILYSLKKLIKFFTLYKIYFIYKDKNKSKNCALFLVGSFPVPSARAPI